jgi:hypothetical protein
LTTYLTSQGNQWPTPQTISSSLLVCMRSYSMEQLHLTNATRCVSSWHL